MNADNVVDLKRKKIMRKHGLTEEDAEDLRQWVINQQIAWVRGLWAEGKEPTEDDLQWLRDRGIDPETLRETKP